MARRIIRFDPPDQFIAGAIGEPGQRIFHLQAIGGGIAATVVVEKSQIAVLARRIVEMLKDLSESGSVQLPSAPLPLPRKLPALAEPFTAEFRVGTIALAWDPMLTRLTLEFRDDMSVEDASAPPPPTDLLGPMVATCVKLNLIHKLVQWALCLTPRSMMWGVSSTPPLFADS
jgi:uncharacterized repeat protein (TIGR03847 family)